MTTESVYDSHDPVGGDDQDGEHQTARRAVRVLVTARAANRLGAFTLPFLAVVLVEVHGASVGQAGLVLSLFGLATIPSRLAGGALADRFGRRRTMVAGLVGCALAQLAIIGSPGLASAALASTALGLCFELYEPPSQAMLSDLVAEGERTHAFGLLAAALAAAGVVSGVLAVVLGGVDLRLLLLADAVSCLACASAVVVALPGTERCDRRATGVAMLREGGPWRDPRLLGMLGSGTAFAALYTALLVALPLTFAARGLPAADAGWAMALSAGVIVLGQQVLRRRAAPPPFAAMRAGYLVLAAGLALLAFATTLPAILLAAVVWSVGDLLLLSHPYAVVAGLAPAAQRARYLAAYGIGWGVAGAVAPLAATTALAVSPTLLWSGAAAASLGLAVAQGSLRRLVERPR